MDTNLWVVLGHWCGLAILFYYLIRGLKQEIKALNHTIATQKKTLDVMEKRVLETEKVGNVYRKFIEDLPDTLDQYKEILNRTKDSIIEQLEEAVREKDKALKEVADGKLEQIKNAEKIISELPKLRADFLKSNKLLESHVKGLTALDRQLSEGERDSPIRSVGEELAYSDLYGPLSKRTR